MSTFERAFMDEYFHARRGNGRGVVAKGPIELRICREAWIYSRRTEKIESDFALWYEFIP